ncbi:HNH endonuclease [Myceligenerans xiligouense]|uniref:HNH endonuclease n=2 Tax=Myceligenerans xiligouense TaxID=253184 RepID=A0A3N4YMY5_9MICO|nr:HNH endonuclease [Myceligenerans xiligouense]
MLRRASLLWGGVNAVGAAGAPVRIESAAVEPDGRRGAYDLTVPTAVGGAEPVALAAMSGRPVDPAERVAATVATPEDPTLDDLARAVDDVAEAEARVAAMSGRMIAAIERARRIAERVSRDALVDTEAAAMATRAQGRRGTLAEWVENLARRGLAAELGAVMQVAAPSAAGLLTDAEILASTGARVLDELLDGRISLAHARAMASQLAGLDPEVADKVTDEVMNPVVGEDPEQADAPLPPPEQVFTGGVLSPGQVRRRARTAREKHHREPLDVRCEKAADHRFVRLEEAGDGMAYLEAFLPAVTAHGIDDRLRATASQAREQGDPRTRAQLRADTLAELLLAGTPGPTKSGPAMPAPAAPDAAAPVAAGFDPVPSGSTPHRPEPGEAPVRVTGAGVPTGTPGKDEALTCRVHEHGGGADHGGVAGDGSGGPGGREDREAGDRGQTSPGHALHPQEHDDPMWLVPLARSIRPVVHVTVPLLRIAGLPGHEDLDPGAGPAMLDGQVPVDDEIASRLIAQAPSLRRLLTHPETGAVVSVGRDSYVVPADLREYLKIRDVTCRWPGCGARAERCDVDHVTDWADGGRTDHDNLVHLCRAHHITKHQTRWTSHLAADGTITWTSPTGRRWTTHPQGHLTTGKEAPGRARDHDDPGPPQFDDAVPF